MSVLRRGVRDVMDTDLDSSSDGEERNMSRATNISMKWIRQMTNSERNYFFATCVLSLVLVLLVVAIILFSILGGQYCVSKECIRTAAQILGGMNSSADPCTDFYEFACGGWRGIGGDEEDNWSLRMLKDTTRQAAELLSKNNSKTELEAVKKARSIYRSCMATDVLDSLGLEPLLEILERAGLPRGIPNKKTAAVFDLSRTIARVHRTLGKPVLIDVLRETDETFTVWMPPLDINDTPNLAVLEAIDSWANAEAKNRSDLLANSTFHDDWQAFVRDISQLAEDMEALKTGRFSKKSTFDGKSDFVPPKMKRLKMPASRITTILYNGTVPNNISNTLYYEVYMEALLEGRPEVNWTLNRGTLRLADPEYHSFLVSALKDYSPLNIQMLVWTEVVKHFGVHTTTSLRQRMKNRLLAMKSQAPRSESCAELLINLMPVVVDHLMAQVDPIKDVTEKVTAMTKEIQQSQRELVRKANWLDEWGLKNILKHLDEVRVARVGYIDWVVEGRGLDEFFTEVKVYDKKLLRTMADIQVWQAETNMLVSPQIGRLRTDHVLASAYYYRSMNTITVRPMIMRFPFYPLGLEALNYGAMGLVLGHEFGHALDAEAFMANDYFFSEKPAVTKVDSFVNCTKRRIVEFSTELKAVVNPDLSINEDISDISGIKSALYTFNKIRRGPEPHLPGLESFTHDQLFFLAFGNVWCTNGKPPGPEAEDGPHNANRFRILSAASNTPEFADIWHCPPDTPMNPKDKCTLW